MKINNFQRELTYISAEKEALPERQEMSTSKRLQSQSRLRAQPNNIKNKTCCYVGVFNSIQ